MKYQKISGNTGQYNLITDKRQKIYNFFGGCYNQVKNWRNINMESSKFKVGELTATIGCNTAAGKHCAGYNGIWHLTHESSQFFDRRSHIQRLEAVNKDSLALQL